LQDDGVHLNWPQKYRRTGWWAEPGASSKNDNYDNAKNEILDFFKAAEAYLKGKGS